MKTRKDKRVLAIDPGTHYIGVAILDDARLAYYGVKTLLDRKSPHDILTEGRKVIKTLIDDFDPAAMAVEKTFFANNRNSALLNVFADEIGSIGRRMKLDVRPMAANTVRKIICSNGKATKQDIAKEIARRYPELSPYLTSDRKWKESYYHNMFDAVALGLAAQDETARGRKWRVPRWSVKNSPNNLLTDPSQASPSGHQDCSRGSDHDGSSSPKRSNTDGGHGACHGR